MTDNRIERFHSLDGARAAMMLLGLVLHSACSYSSLPLGASWPFQDPVATSPLFTFLVFYIHLFRMPAFFVIAGFFAAFLYYRDGASRFAAHRVKRVLVPLALAWVLLYPVVRMGFI